MGYLYTCDKDYEKINVVNDGKERNLIQGIDPKFIDHLKSKMDIYFSLIVKTLRDSIPKTIGYFLIKESQENLDYELFNTFSKSNEIITMLNEVLIFILKTQKMLFSLIFKFFYKQLNSLPKLNKKEKHYIE